MDRTNWEAEKVSGKIPGPRMGFGIVTIMDVVGMRPVSEHMEKNGFITNHEREKWLCSPLPRADLD